MYLFSAEISVGKSMLPDIMRLLELLLLLLYLLFTRIEALYLAL